jgi:hypothetical protein
MRCALVVAATSMVTLAWGTIRRDTRPIANLEADNKDW